VSPLAAFSFFLHDALGGGGVGGGVGVEWSGVEWKVTEYEMCVVIFFTTLLSFSKELNEMCKGLHVKYPIFGSDFSDI